MKKTLSILFFILAFIKICEGGFSTVDLLFGPENMPGAS